MYYGKLNIRQKRIAITDIFSHILTTFLTELSFCFVYFVFCLVRIAKVNECSMKSCIIISHHIFSLFPYHTISDVRNPI